jgi:hypothetical protein
MNKDINQWMVKRKFAKNEFAAHHMFIGLRLSEVPRFWARVKRIVMYRDWRNSGAYPKSNTRACYDKAIAGERVPKLNLDIKL